MVVELNIMKYIDQKIKREMAKYELESRIRQDKYYLEKYGKTFIVWFRDEINKRRRKQFYEELITKEFLN